LAAYCLAGRLLASDFKATGSNLEIELSQILAGGDCHIIERLPGKKNIAIDQIRNFINILGLGAFTSGYKLGIIKAAETLSLEAANSLLKLLEEPKPGVVLILLTSSLDNILPTIVSRSQVINFFPVDNSIIRDYLVSAGASLALANELAPLSGGRPGRAISFWHDQSSYNNYLKQIQIFIDFWKNDLVDRFQSLALLTSADDAAADAMTIINSWEAVGRDLLLLNLNNNDLISHRSFLNELKLIAVNFDLNQTNNIFAVLQKAKEYLAANVAAKNVLEFVAINI